MTLILDVFLEIPAPQNMVRYMCGKPCFRGTLDRQHGKCVERSHLVIHIFLRLFVNTLTVNHKHYPLNRDNLTQPIQMHLSQKQRTFFRIFF